MRRLALQRKEAAAALGIGVDSFDRHVRPHIACTYIGSTRLWTVAELERWLAGATTYPVGSGRNAKRPGDAPTPPAMAQRSEPS